MGRKLRRISAARARSWKMRLVAGMKAYRKTDVLELHA
jgi:hypothetical protein